MADVPTPSVTGAPLHQTPNSPSTIEPQPHRPTTTNPTDSKSKRTRNGVITSFFPKKVSKLNEESTQSGGPSSLPLNVDSEDGETHERGNSNPTSQPSIVLRLSETEIASLPHDPGLRKRISDYHPNDKEIVQREYIRRGPCQPKDYDFPQKLMSKSERKFKAEWFKNFESWLEYSQAKDAAFCFVCYLFKKDNAVGGDAFVSNGFKTWSRTDAFNNHVGNHKSTHNNAMRDLDNFKKQKYSIVSRFENHSTATKSAYLTRLEASIKTTRFLLLQGLSFRGHDEKETSLNRGNFIELLKLLAQHDQNIAKVVLENAPKNCILASSKIQKQIVNACAMETTMKIVKELDGDFFGILADESADIADKEQMALCLRFVDKKGQVKERFFGIVHVGDTTSLTLKEAIYQLLKKYSLTFSKVRGQGYDGASNMQGSTNGLKTLILNESPSAYFVHCFAHQLQLILVAVAKKNYDCSWLFETLANLLNLVGSSPKRKEILKERQAEHVLKEIEIGEIESGSGLNQELGLSRPGDTRWHSHFKTILRVLTMYSSILDAIDTIGEISSGAYNLVKARVHFLCFEDV
ncbi:uncharacterized protein LOC141607780 [Silene latifolia]|uniref:uncharacterized protein LOC141607780 n=1 Tax=Silene latifolia TaxID=37657 RepID=UPI003D7836AF